MGTWKVLKDSPSRIWGTLWGLNLGSALCKSSDSPLCYYSGPRMHFWKNNHPWHPKINSKNWHGALSYQAHFIFLYSFNFGFEATPGSAPDFWLCTQELLLWWCSGDPYGMSEIKTKLALCNAKPLPAVLLLQVQIILIEWKNMCEPMFMCVTLSMWICSSAFILFSYSLLSLLRFNVILYF